MTRRNVHVLLGALFAVLIAVFLFALGRNYLSCRGFWWDEAAQFWIAQA